MKQHTKNKHNHKSKRAAKKAGKYCQSKEKHPDHDLTPQQSHGLTTTDKVFDHEEQILKAYQFQERFAPGACPTRINDWPIVTDAKGVSFTSAQLEKNARAFFEALGPGTFGILNHHIPKKPGKDGKISGPDENALISPYRKIGPFIMPRRDPEKSEYRLLKAAEDCYRLELEEDGVEFPDIDAERLEKRRADKKQFRSEELAEAEWSRMLSQAQGTEKIEADFSKAESVLGTLSATQAALEERGYVFKPATIPATIQPTGTDPVANCIFWVSHPRWLEDRRKNAKAPIPQKAQPPKTLVNLVEIIMEARALVRAKLREHLYHLEKQKEAVQRAVIAHSVNDTDRAIQPAPEIQSRGLPTTTDTPKLDDGQPPIPAVGAPTSEQEYVTGLTPAEWAMGFTLQLTGNGKYIVIPPSTPIDGMRPAQKATPKENDKLTNTLQPLAKRATAQPTKPAPNIRSTELVQSASNLQSRPPESVGLPNMLEEHRDLIAADVKQLDDAQITQEIAIISGPGNNRSYHIKDIPDICERLVACGYEIKEVKDNSLIISASGKQLELPISTFAVRTQRHILRNLLYSKADGVQPSESLDLEDLNVDAYNFADWEYPPFGKFWEEAEKVCSSPELAATWRQIAKSSANIHPRSKRLNFMDGWMDDSRISQFAQFVLIQVHFRDSVRTGCCQNKLEKSAPEFQPAVLGFIMTAAAKERLTRKQQIRMPGHG